MQIAIHHEENTFSQEWISYCKNNNIPFKIIDAYSTDLIENLKGCNIVMWHHIHANFKETLAAKPILFSLEQAGYKVFPDFKTEWHYDDKVGQKYLMEAIQAPLVPSYVFYSKKEALKWSLDTTFPKVFKLRGGAGSQNVKLLNSQKEAEKVIIKAFGKGFKQFDGKGYFIDVFKKYISGIKPLSAVYKAFGRMLVSTEYAKKKGNEKGYVYFQDFIPSNDSDIRVIVIKDKAFAIKRMVRKGDFRASGSGSILYNPSLFSRQVLQLAFNTASKLGGQCYAFDFIFDSSKNPLLVEVSYGFAMAGYKNCPGFWDKDLCYHEEKFNPYGWMVENIISS